MQRCFAVQVAGCLKNIAVVWYGVVAHKEHVSVSQVRGFGWNFVLAANERCH